MTNPDQPSAPPTLTLVEKLYAVHNINTLVPEKLDLAESNYSTWSYFFKGHYSNFGVLKHIEGSSTQSANIHTPTDDLDHKPIPFVKIVDFSYTILNCYISQDDVVTYAINGLSDKYGSLAQIIAPRTCTYMIRLVPQDPANGKTSIWIRKYATEVLERAGMLTCNPCRTPVDTDSKLAAAGDLVYDPTLYPRFVGALQYLTFTQSDISYAVQQVCLFMHDPQEPHFSALKRILRYVRGTLTSGLQLYSSTTSSLVAYC
ncbi:ribonuclease H-like domain-containing protein [Tanacetum coccineum]